MTGSGRDSQAEALVGPPERRRWFWVLYGAWLFGTFAYFLPAATWNPVSRFELTRSVVERGKLDIDTFADSTGDRAFAAGHWYSDKAPLPALLAVPAYALLYAWDQRQGQDALYTASGTDERPALRVTVNRPFARGLYVSSMSTAALGGVALSLAIYEVLRRRVAPVIAFASTTATVLGTPLFAYATSLYGHTLAAALLFGAVAFVDERAAQGDGFGPTARHGPLRWSGMCLVAAIGCEYLAVVPALVIGLAILFRLPRAARPRALLDLAEGGVVPALVIATYHTACFGAPWRTGYSFIVASRLYRAGPSGSWVSSCPASRCSRACSSARGADFFTWRPSPPSGSAGCCTPCESALWIGSYRSASPRSVALLMSTRDITCGGAARPRDRATSCPRSGSWPSVWRACSRNLRLRYPALGVALVSIFGMLLLVGVGIEAPEEGDIMLDYVWRSFCAGDLSRLQRREQLGHLGRISRGGSLGPLLAWWIVGGRYLARAAGTDER